MKDPEAAAEWKARLEHHVKARGLEVLGWRTVPTDNSELGPSALESEPLIEQLFVGRNGCAPGRFELELYVAKQSVSREAAEAGAAGRFYVRVRRGKARSPRCDRPRANPGSARELHQQTRAALHLTLVPTRCAARTIAGVYALLRDNRVQGSAQRAAAA